MHSETMAFDHSTFLSPFTWRYGSRAMRGVWSEEHKRRLWRRLWVALAEAECEAGLIASQQVDDLRAHQNDIDLRRSEVIEAEIHHDLMAEVKTYAEQCPIGGGIVHLGATSMDIEDNADALRLREALRLIQRHLADVLRVLAAQIGALAQTSAMAYTHLQPAEPTTIGYRLAQYGQDLWMDLEAVRSARETIRGKGLKGAVGTSASYAHLLQGTAWSPRDLESAFMHRLDLTAFPVSTQVYPRKQDLRVLNVLAETAASLHKMAFDLRILQSPSFGEMSEPFGSKQVGSSAMPFKRNPINSEKICSLARFVSALPAVAWQNAANCLLERTLDDSANRRVILAEAFLALDEALGTLQRVLSGWQISMEGVERNLSNYGLFAASETLLMALVKAGGDRQLFHERIREHCLIAWGAVQRGDANPLASLLSTDPAIRALLPAAEVLHTLTDSSYHGDAPQRCADFVAELTAYLDSIGDDFGKQGSDS